MRLIHSSTSSEINIPPFQPIPQPPRLVCFLFNQPKWQTRTTRTNLIPLRRKDLARPLHIPSTRMDRSVNAPTAPMLHTARQRMSSRISSLISSQMSLKPQTHPSERRWQAGLGSPTCPTRSTGAVSGESNATNLRSYFLSPSCLRLIINDESWG